MKSLSVVCPAFNEEKGIEKFYQELRAVLATVADRYSSTIVFVMDRGTDNTLEILRRIAANDSTVRILALSSRFGHQMALVAGIDHCDTDAIVMLDSDLQHPPGLIPEMLSQFEKGFDIVYAIRSESNESGFLKRLTSKWFYRLINQLSKVPIHENSADFRLISRKVATVFQKQIRERNQFLRGLFSWVGFKKAGVRFQVQKRYAGRSKYSTARLFQFAMEGIVSFSKKPLQAAIIAGFIVAMLSVLLAVVSIVDFFHSNYLPKGWTTLVVLVAGLSGIQLIFLGLIGQYIGAIFDEVKARPHYIVEEMIGFEKP